MKIRSSNIYVPFFERPLEVLFFYWLGADFAMHELGTWFPTPGEFTAALACIWDGEQFTPADAADFLRMSERLEAGTVWINTYRAVSFMAPFGGVKRSGIGRESGQAALEEYLDTKTVWIDMGAPVANPFVIR